MAETIGLIRLLMCVRHWEKSKALSRVILLIGEVLTGEVLIGEVFIGEVRINREKPLSFIGHHLERVPTHLQIVIEISEPLHDQR